MGWWPCSHCCQSFCPECPSGTTSYTGMAVTISNLSSTWPCGDCVDWEGTYFLPHSTPSGFNVCGGYYDAGCDISIHYPFRITWAIENYQVDLTKYQIKVDLFLNQYLHEYTTLIANTVTCNNISDEALTIKFPNPPSAWCWTPGDPPVVTVSIY